MLLSFVACGTNRDASIASPRMKMPAWTAPSLALPNAAGSATTKNTAGTIIIFAADKRCL